MKEMNLTESIALLREYNRWRRGDDENQTMPNPTEVGLAIEAVCDHLGDANKKINETATPGTDAFNEVHCTCGTLLSSKIAALRKERDEAKMLLTGKLEGAHYAAMKQLQKEMEGAKMSEEPKLDAAKRPNGLRAMADGMIYLAGQTGVETANVWQTADILRAAAGQMERLKEERDEALLQLGAMQSAFAEELDLSFTPTTPDEMRQALRSLVACGTALAKAIKEDVK